ncbi:MAG: putative toxin-antitoxin system toxin component, PIN family [Armatimonadota bacterium]|nr:putative toxin-antitoxin system toxin component, PIN family [Armatimonadota bacterium]
MAGRPSRAVLDTNVYISALFGGNPEDVYLAALRGQFRLVTSPAILVELARKLREKFRLPESDIRSYITQIGRHADVVRPRERLRILDDGPDNRVLECALEGKADVIVSGDRHLLSLGTYRGIRILRPAEFLRRLESHAADVSPGDTPEQGTR